MIDQSLVYQPLLELEGFSEYFALLKEGKTVDLQPLRDISLLIDIKIARFLNYESFPLITNILILFLTGFFLNKILKHFTDKKFSNLITFIYLVHPAILVAFLEFTSRKHILSFLLFLMSYHFFLKSHFKNKKHYGLSLFCYFLSLFAQPINAGTPLLFFLHKGWRNLINKRNIFLGLPFLISLVLAGYLNVVYYQNENLKGELILNYKHDFERLILGINLYYRQLLYPFNFVYRYDFGSIFNVITLILNLILFFTMTVYFKRLSKESKRIVLLGLSLIGIVFATLFIPKTNILNAVFQNYYILTPTLGFILIITGFKELLPRFNSKQVTAFLALFSIYSIGINNYHHSHRESMLSFLKFSAQIESNCYALQFITTQSIARGDKEEFKEFSKKWFEKRCIVILEEYMYSRVLINTFKIMYSDDFDYKEKRLLFSGKFVSPHDFIAVMAILNFELEKVDIVDKYLAQLKGFEEPSIFFNHTFYGKEFDEMCQDSELDGCKAYSKYRKDTEGKEAVIGYRNNLIKKTPPEEGL